MTETCETCRFWRPLTQLQSVGQCRIKSPIASPDDSASWWPLTDNKDWCGEHQPKP